MLTSFAAITSKLPPIVPGVGGALITGIQVMATLTSFSAETNPQTTAQYSKFAPQESKVTKMIGSKDGMTLIYLPAFVVGSALYYLADLSFLPERTLAGQFVIVHFLKRLLEVQFLHKYSGKVSQNLSLGIGVYYALASALICSIAFPAEIGSTAKTVGSALFLIGQGGNLYHHYLLSKLRDSKKTEEQYVAPKGGLFRFVATPHYLFELIGWLGIAAVAQQMNAFLVFTSMSSYLAGRAVSQNAWNRSKFSDIDWPASRKNIVPFIF
mmetsp:Transcript_48810/g.95422  ORF Transcript_48810/g.95422 Transcript_48810/m.95422 type:complete len:268 (+) Transcript_48810:240-1043(+)